MLSRDESCAYPTFQVITKKKDFSEVATAIRIQTLEFLEPMDRSYKVYF
jgi:hypothetical protein